MSYHEFIQSVIDILWNWPYIIITHTFRLVCNSQYRGLYSYALECRPDFTMIKALQLYAIFTELLADDLQYGAGRGVLGTDVFRMFKNDKTVATLSICTCCAFMGVTLSDEEKAKLN